MIPIGLTQSAAPRPAARLASLDILRTFAVLLVLGRHTGAPPLDWGGPIRWFFAGWQRGGWVGVDLFFVLSGFLVSGLLFSDFKKTGHINVMRFYIRRGFKIYPAFYLMIFATIIVLWISRHPAKLGNILAELLFVQNYFTGLWNHTWSLAVEEHFYLGLPLILLLLQRRRTDGKPFSLLPWVVSVTAIACLGFRFIVNHQSGVSLVERYAPTHLRIDSLFFGVLIAYWFHFHHDNFERFCSGRMLILIVLGLTGLAPAFFFELESPWMTTVGFTILSLASGLLLIAAVRVPQIGGGVGRLLAYIGEHSYSIYLWHMPVYSWIMYSLVKRTVGELSYGLNLVFSISIAIGVGIIMAKVVEYPMLRVRDRWFPSPVKPINSPAPDLNPPANR